MTDTKPQTTLSLNEIEASLCPEQLAYMKKIFGKFHTADNAGRAMAHSWALGTLANMPHDTRSVTLRNTGLY